MEENKIDNVLDVLGGNKDFKVSIEPTQIAMAGVVIFVAIFLASLLAQYIALRKF